LLHISPFLPVAPIPGRWLVLIDDRRADTTLRRSSYVALPTIEIPVPERASIANGGPPPSCISHFPGQSARGGSSLGAGTVRVSKVLACERDALLLPHNRYSRPPAPDTVLPPPGSHPLKATTFLLLWSRTGMGEQIGPSECSWRKGGHQENSCSETTDQRPRLYPNCNRRLDYPVLITTRSLWNDRTDEEDSGEQGCKKAPAEGRFTPRTV
jgi:hypothetical protein